MNGNALGFGNPHKLPGLGIAPWLGRSAVAELGTVSLFLAYDHDRLGVALFATPAHNDGPGHDKAGVKAVFVGTADLRKVVVDVFQDVPEADALGMAHNAHLVQRADQGIKPGLDIAEKILHGAQGCIGIFQEVLAVLFLEVIELFLQQGNAVCLFACKNILNI